MSDFYQIKTKFILKKYFTPESTTDPEAGNEQTEESIEKVNQSVTFKSLKISIFDRIRSNLMLSVKMMLTTRQVTKNVLCKS